MKVKELKKILNKYPDDMDITIMEWGNGYGADSVSRVEEIGNVTKIKNALVINAPIIRKGSYDHSRESALDEIKEYIQDKYN